MNWEVVSNCLWVWQSHTVWQKFPLMLLLTVFPAPLFCFVLLYWTTSACTSNSRLLARHPECSCWRSQWTRRGLRKPMWLFTVESSSQTSRGLLSLLQMRKLMDNSRLLSFITENIMKVLRRETKHVLLSCFHYLQPQHDLLQLVVCQKNGSFLF